MTPTDPIPESALQRLGSALANLLDDDQWNNIEKNYLLPALEHQERMGVALKEVKGFVCGEQSPNWVDQHATTASRLRVANTCDVALLNL